jgi:hypothetical protein
MKIETPIIPKRGNWRMPIRVSISELIAITPNK